MSALVDAFERDPLSRWLYPDTEARREANRHLFAELIGAARQDRAIDVTDDLGAAAIWLPPGGEPDLDAPQSVAPAAARLFDMLRVSKPAGEFWYLAFLGARTAGTGAGSALLRHRLAALDGAASLWTGNAANLAFYTRFGFELGTRCDVPGASAWWLIRHNPTSSSH